jgi:TetR/AcrR family transcriptional regulator, regulator of cefoperazone and chloramphenicol sensitivity
LEVLIVGAPNADLTARARIRDAALLLFAERGIDGATIRDIATAAGVSAGLVRHHFGSKEALRDACDTYALERLMEIKQQAWEGSPRVDLSFLPSAHPTILMLMRYFVRSMVDGSPAAAGLFDRMVTLAEEWFAKYHTEPLRDPRAFAAVLVGMQTGLLIMHDHVSRALGADVLSREGNARMGRATVDFYASALIDPERAATAHAAYDRLLAEQPGGNPTPNQGAGR